jgi:putative DNA-invertase from lambdoid prophage Rac
MYYTDVVDTIREFMRRGVIVKTVINGMAFDGSTQTHATGRPR